MTELLLSSFVEQALPDLDPIIAHEPTSYGWRGLTQQGEVYEVKGSNGHKAEVPSEIVVAHLGKPIGRRQIHNDESIDIESYLEHFNLVVAHYKANRITEALREAEATTEAAPTLRAKFNRAMILLAAGRWRQGFDEYWQCEQHAPFMRPQVRAALDRGLKPWQGQDLHGKRLLLMHAHGFGDTIQMLRYIPSLRVLGAEVVLDVPPELQSLTCETSGQDGDYFCPILHLLRWIAVTPQTVDSRPYLAIKGRQVAKWQEHLSAKPQAWSRCEQLGMREGTPAPRRIGLAWSIGKPSDGDYPRQIPLAELVENFAGDELHSVQVQEGDEARALGVAVHEFADFADCAALMLCMDEIVSVDTAALHLAGAIGHPRVFGLLSHWASWRWLAPWYQNVTLCRQERPGDWTSALAKIYPG